MLYFSRFYLLVKIGIILPLTGPASKYGKWARNSIELAVKEIRKTDPSLKVLFGDGATEKLKYAGGYVS